MMPQKALLIALLLLPLVGDPAGVGREMAAPGARVANGRHFSPLHGPGDTSGPSQQARTKILENYGTLPLRFEQNQGQFDRPVKFLSRGSGYSLFLTGGEAVLSLSNRRQSGVGQRGLPESKKENKEKTRMSGATLRIEFVGGNPAATVVGLEALAGKSNYFIGSDPQKWRTNVPNYAKVKYQDVYPGIDLVYYGNQGELEFDFIVAAAVSPSSISLRFGGADKLEVDAAGDLIVEAQGEQVRLKKPVAYQETKDGRQEVACAFDPAGNRRVGFKLAAYDSARPLVIDPVLLYSTFLNGSGSDEGYGIAVDSSGSAYVTGGTTSSNFPTANALQAGYGGGGDSGDAFVTKLNPAGSALLYSTYLGGTGDDGGSGIAVDSSGSAYVTGGTRSSNFPTANALQASSGGGFYDAFVTKLNPAGSALVYSTYLGGSDFDSGSGIAVDSSGNAYVTGHTRSSNFPTANSLQASPTGLYSDVFVTKLNPAGSALLYSTYLGGNDQDVGYGIAVDSSGSAYVTGDTSSFNFPTANALQAGSAGGNDAFVTKLNPAGSALLYSTYLGGNGHDVGFGIAVDSSGSAYVTGLTRSSNFPTANALQASSGGGFYDAFVTKLNPAGSALLYSTYLGGNGEDRGSGIAVDSSGSVYVTGFTSSSNFPTANALQAGYGCCSSDAFVTKLNPAGSALLYSTYLGGSGLESGSGIAVDSSGSAYVTGFTGSSNFPTANALQAGSGGAFVTKLSGSAAEVAYTTPALGGISVATLGIGPLVTGYARIVATSGNTTPAGLAIFGFRQTGILVTEAGVPASAPILTGRIYAEVGGAVNTGLALANPNGQPAAINFFFTDAAGNNFGAGSTTVAANGQIAAFLNQPPFNGANNVNGAFTFTSNVPVGVIALRGLNNERGEFLITTLPVADLSQAASTQTVLLPHFADGGGWTTQVVLVNPSDEVQSGSVQFVSQGTAGVPAQPAPVTIGGVTASSFVYTIAARSSRVLRTSNPAGATQAGSVRITPQAGARAPSGLGIFSFRPAGVTVTEAGVVATAPATAQRMYAESSGADGGLIQTAVAVANSGIDAVNVDFSLTHLNGSATGLSGRLTVPGNGGQVALFLNQIDGFKTLPTPFQGVLRIASTTPTGVAVVGLRGRTNERGDFLITTIPAVDENAPASGAERIFPHFADGGGYTTQFILFSGSANQTAAGRLLFFGQSGLPLTLNLK